MRRRTSASAFCRPSASTWPASRPSTSPRSCSTNRRRLVVKQGILFCDMDTALREYPDLVKQYFGTAHPPRRQQVRGAELLGAGPGGSFIYAPPGSSARCRGRPTSASTPRTPASSAHADHRRRGREAHYIEGCSAPVYTKPTHCTPRWSRSSSSRARRVTYTTIQRTGRRTSTTWSDEAGVERPRDTWSGSTATSAPS